MSYVEYGQQSLQGADLYRDLTRVYGTEGRYCLMLVSGHYKDKLWGQPGRVAQDRAFSEGNERILPVRIDDTALPGPLSTYGYLDLREHSVDQIVELLFAKLESGTAISTVDRDRTAVSGAALPTPPAQAPLGLIRTARTETRDRDTRRWDAEFRLAAAIFDRVALARLSADYAAALYAAPRLPTTVGAVLQTLRQNLCHEEMELVADAALAHEIDSPVVRRQYAQVLVDGANPAAALRFYAELARDESVPERDRAEADGGIGRCYKELFLACSDPVRRRDYLQRALDAYLDRYRRDPALTYHGINAVALLLRAEREQIPLDHRGARPAELAEDILATLGADPMPDLWSEATACEAAIALERHNEALEHAEAFVSMNPQGFTVASLLRQLRSVWTLHTAARPGSDVLPVLRSAFLHYQGGRVTVAATDVRAARLATLGSGDLERLVDADRLRTLRWYRQGLLRCRAVAALRVGDAAGTGVLVARPALHTSLPPVVLLTTASVVPESTRATDVEVVFPAASADQADPVRVEVARLHRDDGWSDAERRSPYWSWRRGRSESSPCRSPRHRHAPIRSACTSSNSRSAGSARSSPSRTPRCSTATSACCITGRPSRPPRPVARCSTSSGSSSACIGCTAAICPRSGTRAAPSTGVRASRSSRCVRSGRRRRRVVLSRQAGARPGRRSASSAPPSGACPAHTAPPWRSATCRTMDRPKPEPGIVRAPGDR